MFEYMHGKTAGFCIVSLETFLVDCVSQEIYLFGEFPATPVSEGRGASNGGSGGIDAGLRAKPLSKGKYNSNAERVLC